jgi:hypothetical protein
MFRKKSNTGKSWTSKNSVSDTKIVFDVVAYPSTPLAPIVPTP